MRKFLLLVAGLAFAAAALAQQYKWVDRDGRVQYGDTPPAGVKATPLRAPSSAPSPPASRAPAGKKDEKPLTPEQAFQKRQKDRSESEQKAKSESAEAETKRANCASAQSKLRGLQSGQRIGVTDASGERTFMDDAQRAAEMQRAEKAVADWCN